MGEAELLHRDTRAAAALVLAVPCRKQMHILNTVMLTLKTPVKLSEQQWQMSILKIVMLTVTTSIKLSGTTMANTVS